MISCIILNIFPTVKQLFDYHIIIILSAQSLICQKLLFPTMNMILLRQNFSKKYHCIYLQFIIKKGGFK